MNKKTKLILVANVYVLFCAASLLLLSLMAFGDPKSVMKLVQVELNNNDALSSIRGVYGGVGLTIVLTLVYLVKNNTPLALLFLAIFWASYAFSRVITVFADGTLGSFGTNWLKIESLMSVVAFTLYFMVRNTQQKHLHTLHRRTETKVGG